MKIIDLTEYVSDSEKSKIFIEMFKNDITKYGNVKKIVGNGHLEITLMDVDGFIKLKDKPKMTSKPYLVAHFNDIEIYTNPLILWGELEYTFIDDSGNRIESFKTQSNGGIL